MAVRDHDIAAFDPLGQKPLDAAFKLRPAFRRLTRRQGEGHGLDVAKPGFERAQMRRGDGFVGQNRNPRPGKQGADFVGRIGDQAAADPDVVAAVAQRDVHGFGGHCGASRMSGCRDRVSITRSVIWSIVKSNSASTTISASA